MTFILTSHKECVFPVDSTHPINENKQGRLAHSVYGTRGESIIHDPFHASSTPQESAPKVSRGPPRPVQHLDQGATVQLATVCEEEETERGDSVSPPT